MLQHHHLGTREDERSMHASYEYLEPARFSDRQPATGERRRRVAHGLSLPDLRHALGAPPATSEAVEQRDGLVTGDAVGRKAGVRLELGQRARGRGSEDAVDAAGIEPEHPETALQLSDIVAALHRTPEIEEPVAEVVARFDDRGPRLEIADAVAVEAASDLERAYGGLGCLAVAAVLSLARVEACSCQPALKVSDRLARCAEAQRQTVYRNSPSSWRS
jgi:hypothetical protein